MAVLTHRFTQAFDYARIAHAAQVRKGTDTPYLSHLMGVASLVLEHGGNEDQAIAGLLHDIIEDCGQAHEHLVRAQFGDAVAQIVLDCTDGTHESKAVHSDREAKRMDWQNRKLKYLQHLEQASDSTLLVSACDKLHNAGAIVADMNSATVGILVFDRFTSGREGTLAYYHSLSEVFSKRGIAAAERLDAVVLQMHEGAGSAQRVGLGLN
jgi:(p)ppGpp synthase/HD superfamily hydrolase